MASPSPVVVVTGANGLVVAVCRCLFERSAQVRAVVRRSGSAPALEGLSEYVGEFADEDFAAARAQGADAVVTTVHPMGSSRETQHRVGVEGTPVLARAARGRRRRPARARLHRGRLRPLPGRRGRRRSTRPAPDGAAPTPTPRTPPTPPSPRSTAARGRAASARRRSSAPGERRSGTRCARARSSDDDAAGNPARTFAWGARRATWPRCLAGRRRGRGTPTARRPRSAGPLAGRADPRSSWRASPRRGATTSARSTGAAGRRPRRRPTSPAWTGRRLTDRARRWGWAPRVGLAQALDELRRGLVPRRTANA